MFKWPETPTRTANSHELADFVELVTWRDGRMSAEELKRHLDRLDEAGHARPVLAKEAPVLEEEGLDPVVDAVFEELECRLEACAGNYPFRIAGNGRMVRFDPDVESRAGHLFYVYMLLATRLNMNADRTHAGIDGSGLFEELAAEAAKGYLGGRAESLVFGTAADDSSFEAKVSNLCVRTGEGDGFYDHVSAGRRKKDGRLDVVAWTPFADGRPSKLLVFGQCKTGTHYRDELVQLHPDVFCRKWFRSQPAVTPVRAFFVTEALPRAVWRDFAVDAGLLFDRCRVVDFIGDVSAEVVAKVQAWTAGAAGSAELARISAADG